MKPYLELIKCRSAEIEASLTAPCTGRISVSCDFIRQLLAQAQERPEVVSHIPGSPVYFFDDLVVQADGSLPNNCFVIDLT